LIFFTFFLAKKAERKVRPNFQTEKFS